LGLLTIFGLAFKWGLDAQAKVKIGASGIPFGGINTVYRLLICNDQ
jgi:hypothetical protein